MTNKWDPLTFTGLMESMAWSMSLELRAMYNLGQAKGLDCWGPVLNLARYNNGPSPSSLAPCSSTLTECVRQY